MPAGQGSGGNGTVQPPLPSLAPPSGHRALGTPTTAQIDAEKYARVIGQLPAALRKDVETVWIHKGVQPFGGGNRNLLIHTGQADLYAADGILEEAFVHEATHTSLDSTYASTSLWQAAQQADGEFI